MVQRLLRGVGELAVHLAFVKGVTQVLGHAKRHGKPQFGGDGNGGRRGWSLFNACSMPRDKTTQ